MEQQILLICHLLVALILIVLVLIQQGKGATMGAAFGSGASQTVFGSQGSGSFLLKVTGLFAALFFVTSLSLGYLATQQSKMQAKAQPLPAALMAPVQKPVQKTPSKVLPHQ